jgi:hypothetical protein
VTDTQAALPPIEKWWPYLTIGSRNAVVRSDGRPLEYRVIAEIQRATGEEVPPGAVLSDRDRSFVATQMEAVD